MVKNKPDHARGGFFEERRGCPCSADTVAGETNTADNTNSTTSTVTSHDVAVTSVTDSPDPVNQGATVTVDVTVTNQGSFAETFNVTLTSDQDGLIHTWTGVNLGAGATTTPVLTYDWDTTSATVATHTLTATAGPVSGELDTGDNSGVTTNTVNSALVHDVAVDTVTAPASTPQGGTTAVDVDISNPGGFTENIDVSLSSNLDGTIQTINTGSLAAGGSTTLNFSWDTTGASVGTHTLTATWTHDGGDGGTDANAGNNSASTSSEVTAGVIHDVAVISVTASPDPVGPTTGGGDDVTLTAIVENQGTVSESIDLTIDASTVAANKNPVCEFTGVTLGAGATSTTEFRCTWTVKSNINVGLNTLTATATIAVDDDLADNIGTGTLQVNP